MRWVGAGCPREFGPDTEQPTASGGQAAFSLERPTAGGGGGAAADYKWGAASLKQGTAHPK